LIEKAIETTRTPDNPLHPRTLDGHEHDSRTRIIEDIHTGTKKLML
jgi:hypothetical protein